MDLRMGYLTWISILANLAHSTYLNKANLFLSSSMEKAQIVFILRDILIHGIGPLKKLSCVVVLKKIKLSKSSKTTGEEINAECLQYADPLLSQGQNSRWQQEFSASRRAHAAWSQQTPPLPQQCERMHARPAALRPEAKLPLSADGNSACIPKLHMSKSWSNGCCMQEPSPVSPSAQDFLSGSLMVSSPGKSLASLLGLSA